jgi:hypothetical protein
MVITALLLVTLIVLPLIYARDAAREKRQRASFFDDALAVLDSYRVTQDGQGYPVLEGRYYGHSIRLEPVLDDMAWRKVPSLWLKATLLQANPARATFSFMVRPQGGEFYSPASDLAQRMAVPAAWPQNAALCTDDRDLMPDPDALTPDMAAFEDPRLKELVVTPKGVRLVYQAAQAERASYLVLRQAKFDGAKAAPDLVRALLDRAILITRAVDDCRAVLPRSEAA